MLIIYHHGEKHTVPDEPHERSLGNYLLLKQSLRSQEPVEQTYFGKSEKAIRKWKQLEFNTAFLKEALATFGELHCEYCGKQKLVIYAWNDTRPRINIATADHFVPVYIDPSKAFEKKNMIVACENCNIRKGHKVWSKDTLKFKYTWPKS